jgi:Tol biopolymer transport system component
VFGAGGMAFSPNGRVLACGYDVTTGPGLSGFKTRVAVISVKTGRPIRVITLPGSLVGPVWSSSGDLLFVSGGTVETTRPDGSHRRTVNIKMPRGASIDNEAAQPVVPSPDGSQLAVIGANLQGTNDSLYVVPAVGGKATRVAPYAVSAVWSPDGRQIEYDEGLGVNRVLTLETKHVRRLASTAGHTTGRQCRNSTSRVLRRKLVD